MNRFIQAVCLSTIALLVDGCTAYQRHDLNPAVSDAEFRRRSLSDPGLRAFVATRATKPTEWPPAQLDLRALTLVAFYFHPDMDVARAKMGTAEAGVTTAGARPNPAIGIGPEYHSIAEGVSPWTLAFTLDIPVETAGKRGYRIVQARALTDVARLSLGETAWQVRSRVRATLLDYALTLRELELLRSEEAARRETVMLLERRLAVGQVSVVEVDIARIDLNTTTLAVQAAQGRTAEARAVLAAAAGLSDRALDGITPTWPGVETPPTQDALAAASTQRFGLLNRLDVRRLLAEYAAAEAALQLEVAKQYPDLHLGPGYTFDQDDNVYSLGLSVELPVFNRNQGPIAEAEERRKEAAARVLALQAQVIGQTEQATARYRSALAELAEADRLYALQQKRQNAVQRSVQVGEDDRLSLASARVQSAVTARSRLNALRNAQTALGTLEDAVQRPLDGAAVPDVVTANPRDDSQENVKQ